MKVLHVVESLDRGATERWLLRMLAHARDQGMAADWTFYCTLAKPGELEDFARSLGARVQVSPAPIHNKIAFARGLRAELREGGHEVLHCHHDLVSGFYLAAATGLPLRRRIVHVHNPDEIVLTPNRLKQAVLKPALRQICLSLADRIVANSSHSLDTFLAGRLPRPGKDSVHHIGIDPAEFVAARPDRGALRHELGMADDAPILLFAGRMAHEKNPMFAVDVLASLRRHLPQACAVFAGTGSEEAATRAHAAAMGQSEFVHFLGWRSDVARLMAASDWFILPHFEDPPEGFGVAVVEAQLAGLRLILSHGVRDDPLLPGSAVRRLSLQEPSETWAQAAIDLWNGSPPSRADALAALHESPMHMAFALADLQALYQ